ncbi:hypothetical protein AX17_005959 [Amanita inopinata Kibby_2008]|nr:hypothetical protein AX17_005959 [Amanita inopinata Kibby_2008]
MTSHLEALPRDILQHIAYLSCSTCSVTPPSDVLSLLLTSSGLYKCLSIYDAPHLYAKLFRTKFDFSDECCPWRARLTDSSLASDFVERCRTLRRARQRDTSEHLLCQDLVAALWMAIENGGLNEQHLSSVDFSGFVIDLAKRYLAGQGSSPGSQTISRELQALVICLSCYTLTQEKLMNMPSQTRETLLNLLRPVTNHGTTTRTSRAANYIPNSHPLTSCNGHRNKESNVCLASGRPSSSLRWRTRTQFQESQSINLNPLTSAIILTFALKEVVPLVIPPHLPETRALALAAHRSGPTIQDFQATIRCRTPLFSGLYLEDKSGAGLSSTRSLSHIIHDPEFHQLIRNNNKFSVTGTSPYCPGALTGVWEGSYMVSSLEQTTSVNPTKSIVDFACRKPMQCAITEYLCYPPSIPLPHDPDDFFESDVTPRHLSVIGDHIAIQSQKYGYVKLNPTKSVVNKTQRDPTQALDIILLGETLADHEQAWGGYKFVGRIRRDGMIFLKREPKNTEDDLLGTWCFQGCLRYGSAFVGQWSSSACADKVQGVFSMHKSRDR